jgi:DeoR/GlpR family transcriptional regulator of sugar metabolism
VPVVTQGLRYQSAPERRARILEVLRERSYASAAELSGEFGVSKMTIRRNIQRLASEGAARAVRGGISVVPHDRSGGDYGSMGTDFSIRTRKMAAAKREIARAALQLIKPESTIALDAGTTTLELARLLPTDMRLRVVTASLPAMVALADRSGIETIGLGGVLRREPQAFAGPPTIAALRELHIHQAFLAASGIRDGQMLCGNLWDSETKRTLVEVSEELILVADSSKFGLSAMTRVGPLSALRTLVVDDGIEEQDRRCVEAAGVSVIVTSPTAEART